jgi:hypothetical protein
MDDTNPIGNYTIGNLFYALGARLLGKLVIGAVNKVLVSTGSAPTWTDSLDLTAVRSDRFKSVSGSSAPGASGAWVSLFTPPLNGVYLLYVRLDGAGSSYHVVGHVIRTGPTVETPVSLHAADATYMHVRQSGNEIQAMQDGSPTPTAIDWTYIRIANS